MKSILSALSKKVIFGTSSALLAFGILVPSTSYAATFVDSELYLSVDVSGSVDANEFNLQKQGYANAFADVDVQNLIESSPNGIAVALGFWSRSNQQMTAVPFTLLKTAADALDFSTLISATTRPFSNLTGVGSAIQFATNELLTNDFDGAKLVIDVSGDGPNNSGIGPAAARDAALASGITTINGLPIGDAGLLSYYENNVQGGTDSFSILANSFSDIDDAVKKKLFREITNSIPTTPTDVPEPGILLGLVGMATATLSLKNRKREEPTA